MPPTFKKKKNLSFFLCYQFSLNFRQFQVEIDIVDFESVDQLFLLGILSTVSLTDLGQARLQLTNPGAKIEKVLAQTSKTYFV